MPRQPGRPGWTVWPRTRGPSGLGSLRTRGPREAVREKHWQRLSQPDSWQMSPAVSATVTLALQKGRGVWGGHGVLPPRVRWRQLRTWEEGALGGASTLQVRGRPLVQQLHFFSLLKQKRREVNLKAVTYSVITLCFVCLRIEGRKLQLNF